MPRRFYLAIRLDRASHGDSLVEALKAHGWERTFDWTGNDSTIKEDLSRLAQAELAAIEQADVLIVLLPGGRGTHVEIGAALALGKPIILHAPDRDTLEVPYPCAFHYHPAVKLLVSDPLDVDEIVQNLPS
ncbi:MAG TPA: nucleoside 2-deoxyribosyltransferase [Acidobacteriaceae bacterium]|nr:nucleoside 2-deoxyribosyltransferase [Acidobacteriaceae bacterium]